MEVFLSIASDSSSELTWGSGMLINRTLALILYLAYMWWLWGFFLTFNWATNFLCFQQKEISHMPVLPPWWETPCREACIL